MAAAPLIAPRLAVLLLPEPLERSPFRGQLEDLLRAPGAVRVDPPPISYGALRRTPLAVRLGLAAGQAKRLVRALPGAVAAVLILDPAQAPLAATLLDRGEGEAELWYAPPVGAAGRLHDLATERAALRFALTPEVAGPPARERNRGLLERMEALGIESGRLGSEKLRAG